MNALFVLTLFLAFVCTSVRAQECANAAPVSNAIKKEQLVERLLDAKHKAGKTFDDIAAAIGTTNAYAAQLFMGQAQLKPATAEKLARIVPGISAADLTTLQKAPTRSFDPLLMQEPLVYRLVEAMQHYGAGIKSLVNEKFGDGILSAIDIFVDLKEVIGLAGERRIAITLNGKYLPHIVQEADNNTALVSQR